MPPTDPRGPDCPICEGIGYMRNDLDVHHPLFGKLVPCACRTEEIALKAAQASGMRAHELERTLADLVPQGDGAELEHLRGLPMMNVVRRRDTAGMLEVCRRFVEEPWGFLTIWGPYGNAKTHAAQAIVNEFRVRHGVAGAYITLAELLGVVRAGFDRGADASASVRLDRFCMLPVLVVDEIDAAKASEWSEETRRRIFDSRYRDACAGVRHTVLAMNCDPEDLPGDLYDRVRDGRFVVFNNRDGSVRPVMGDWGEA